MLGGLLKQEASRLNDNNRTNNDKSDTSGKGPRDLQNHISDTL